MTSPVERLAESKPQIDKRKMDETTQRIDSIENTVHSSAWNSTLTRISRSESARMAKIWTLNNDLSPL